MPKPLRKPNRSARRARKHASLGWSPRDDEWKDFVSSLHKTLNDIDEKTEKRPDRKRDAVFKREVYGFVCRYLDEGRAAHLSNTLEIYTWPRTPISPTFKENPFHLALSAARDMKRQDGVEAKQRWKISRFGRQLLYARRHRIPPELLTGFLHQVGSIIAVGKKADDPTKTEEWHDVFLARLK